MMQVGRNLTDPVDGFVRGKCFLILRSRCPGGHSGVNTG